MLFTHHASSLVLPQVLGALLLAPLAARLLLPLSSASGSTKRSKGALALLESWLHDARLLSSYSSVIFVLLVASMYMHITLSSDILRIALHSFESPFSFAYTSTAGKRVPILWWIYSLRLTITFILLTGAGGVIMALTQSTPPRLAVVLVMVGLLLSGATSLGIQGQATPRILALWYPFGAVFSASLLASGLPASCRASRIRRVVPTVLIACYVGAAIVDAQIPAYLLENAPRSGQTTYGDALPRVDRLELAGKWLMKNTPEDAPTRRIMPPGWCRFSSPIGPMDT